MELTHSSFATPIADNEKARSKCLLSLENVIVNVFAFVLRTKRSPKLSPITGSNHAI